MNPKVEQLARDMFSPIMATAKNLSEVTPEHRKKLYKIVASHCVEAAQAFYEVIDETKEST